MVQIFDHFQAPTIPKNFATHDEVWSVLPVLYRVFECAIENVGNL